MDVKGLAIAMGVGAAVGAVAILAMPKNNPTRKLAAKSSRQGGGCCLAGLQQILRRNGSVTKKEAPNMGASFYLAVIKISSSATVALIAEIGFSKESTILSLMGSSRLR